MAKAFKLDTAKFRKVRALMERGSTDGERDTARRKATEIAAKACMTLDAAIREDDRLLKQEEDTGLAYQSPGPASDGGNWKDAFSDMFKEAGERKQERQERRKAEAFTRFRTMFEVFEPNAMEKALRKAVQPFSEFSPGNTPAGHRVLHTIKLDKCVGEVTLEKLSKRARSAIEQAVQMPPDFAGALREIKAWDELERDRAAFTWHDEWRHDMEVEARILILEDILNSHAVKSWDDLQARFDWNLHHWKRQWLESTERDDPFLDRIEEDFKILRAMSNLTTLQGRDEIRTKPEPATVQNGHAQHGRRTNADKAADVQSLLRSNPEMSNRAIGGRLGVSPQTVANWRAKMDAEGAAA